MEKIVKPYGTHYYVRVTSSYEDKMRGPWSTFKFAKHEAKIHAEEGKTTEILKVVAVVSHKK